ncbi:hypothetical protein A8144_09430 [Mycobacterium leprae 3125609]|nr:hypothetical protein A8144_09430 [Mycobacterium leprae 3125609]OAX70904.1 hypothetical protein A3216_09350 [Mycobacterium leprae 7935681]
MASAWGLLQQFVAVVFWPRLLGHCHVHRDTERSIVNAGFEVEISRREWTLSVWEPHRCRLLARLPGSLGGDYWRLC